MGVETALRACSLVEEASPDPCRDWRVSMALRTLSRVQERAGLLRDAAESMMEAIVVHADAIMNPEQDRFLQDLYLHASTLHGKLKQDDVADGALHQALLMNQSHHFQDHNNVKSTVSELKTGAIMELKLGKGKQAFHMIREAVRLQEALPGSQENHVELGRLKTLLGETMVHINRLDEAKSMYEDSLNMIESMQRKETMLHPRTKAWIRDVSRSVVKKKERVAQISYGFISLASKVHGLDAILDVLDMAQRALSWYKQDNLLFLILCERGLAYVNHMDLGTGQTVLYEAAQVLETLPPQPRKMRRMADALYILGCKRAQFGSPELALPVLRDAVGWMRERAKINTSANVASGKMLYTYGSLAMDHGVLKDGMRKVAQASRLLPRATPRSRSNLWCMDNIVALEKLGDGFRRMKKWKTAASVLKKAVQLDMKAVDVDGDVHRKEDRWMILSRRCRMLYHLGHTLLEIEQMDGTKVALREGVQCLAKAASLVEQGGDYVVQPPEWMGNIGPLVHLRDEIMQMYARGLAMQGNERQAIQVLQEEIQPQDPRCKHAMVTMGRLYCETGDPRRGSVWMEQAAAHFEKESERQAVLQEVETLKKKKR